MRKYLITLLLSFPVFSYAESSVSMILNDIPSHCSPRVIIDEVPIITVGFNFGEIIDISDVIEITSNRNKLECKAKLISNETSLTGFYNVSFTRNSVGDVIVSYQKTR